MKHTILPELIRNAHKIALKRDLSPSVARDVHRAVRRGEAALVCYTTDRELELIRLELTRVIQAQHGN